MRLDIAWDFPALVAFYRLAPWDAMRVDHAVIRYAESGNGLVEHLPPYYRLQVGSYRVRFTIEQAAGVMNVLYVYRTG